ncbi:MAG TPA: hypothetical protein VMA96_18025 [Solirubrobacteraceae bacterium]|nr:hypothetical protein [Solirubrobacteraceae bacterium]
MRCRSLGLICCLAVVVSACGGGARQDASEPSGNFPVAVTTATFPGSQRLSEHTHLVLAVRNTGPKTIPNVAVTICNVTCAYPAPAGEGTDAAAFAQDLQMPGLANPSRPVWVVDRPPGACNAGCQPGSADGSGSPGGAVTAYSNTWALGPLPPGDTAKFDWTVTAVAPGRHVVAWEVAAGLNGKAKAVTDSGALPHGTFAVVIHSAPSESYVNNNGQIVTTSSSAP